MCLCDAMLANLVKTAVTYGIIWYSLCLIFLLLGINISPTFFSPLGFISLFLYMGFVFLMTSN